MIAISVGKLPSNALLERYRASGAYTDCFFADVPHPVTHAEFVEAFYTTAVFKLERLILSVAVSCPSTDTQAGQLARAEQNSFAAWSVEERTASQLLMCDLTSRTRSWFMVAENAASAHTRLYFGSAIVPVRNPKSGRLSLGPVFNALLGFHKLYSRVLLHAAVRKLLKNRTAHAHILEDDA